MPTTWTNTTDPSSTYSSESLPSFNTPYDGNHRYDVSSINEREGYYYDETGSGSVWNDPSSVSSSWSGVSGPSTSWTNIPDQSSTWTNV